MNIKYLTKEELSELNRLHQKATPGNWIAKDLMQGLKVNEDIFLILELRNKAASLIDMAKQLIHSEKWYAARLQHLRDLCEKNNLLTEFCNIVANGKESPTDPPTYQNIINKLERDLEKCKKENQLLQSKLDQIQLSKVQNKE